MSNTSWELMGLAVVLFFLVPAGFIAHEEYRHLRFRRWVDREER